VGTNTVEKLRGGLQVRVDGRDMEAFPYVNGDVKIMQQQKPGAHS
jgi:hypothetical protein